MFPVRSRVWLIRCGYVRVKRLPSPYNVQVLIGLDGKVHRVASSTAYRWRIMASMLATLKMLSFAE
jgi:hypothetical protein